MKNFLATLQKYSSYIWYSAQAGLRSEVSDSYLGWIWWILEPFLFMLVYTFISLVVYGRSEPYFPIFVFLGLGAWNYFNKTATYSVRAVRANKSLLSKAYVPKHVIVLSRMAMNLFKFMITLLLAFCMMPFYKVPLSWNVLYFFPILISYSIIILGISLILLHFGVYVSDLSQVMTIVLRLLFYLSGIFYSIPKRVAEPYANLLLRFNPTAYYINAIRQILLYASPPNFVLLLFWTCVGVLLTWIGLHLVSRYEKNYIKAV